MRGTFATKHYYTIIILYVKLYIIKTYRYTCQTELCMARASRI